MKELKGKGNDLQFKWQAIQAKAWKLQWLKYSIPPLVIMGLFYMLREGVHSGVEPGVKLADVPVLTFRKWKWTKGRLFEEVPQLQCVSTARQACLSFVSTPNEVRCYNKGLDGNNKVVWDCKADFGFPQTDPRMFKQISINCEGSYIYPDEYVLKGSCYLIYNAEPVLSSILNAVLNSIMPLALMAFLYITWNSVKSNNPTKTNQVNYAPSNSCNSTTGISEGLPCAAREATRTRASNGEIIAIWGGALGGAAAAILWARRDIFPISFSMFLSGSTGAILIIFLVWISQALKYFQRQFQRLLSYCRQYAPS